MHRNQVIWNPFKHSTLPADVADYGMALVHRRQQFIICNRDRVEISKRNLALLDGNF